MPQELVVRILGDASSLEKTFRQSARGAQKFDKEMSRTFRGTIAGSGAFRGLGRSIAFASAGFLGGFGLTAAIRGAFDEMSNAQKVAAQTAAVIESTGGVAGVTATHVEELGKSLLNLSGIDDELIKNSENLLLTFTNIRNTVGKGNDIFDRATKAALNLSVRFSKDLASSTILVGKALQDPIKGLTALTRAGVQFSAQQRKQIKALVESGKMQQAQKLILGELEVQTKGAAAAYGRTFAGQLAKFRETLRNVGGAMAKELLPALNRLLERGNAWIGNVSNQRRIMDDFKQVVSAVTDVFDVLRGAFQKLNGITGSTKETLKLLLAALVAVKGIQMLSALTGIASGIGLVGRNAAAATGEVTLLRGALAGLATFGVITLVIEIVLHKKQIDDFFGRHGLGFLNKSLLQHLKDDLEARKGDTGTPEWLFEKIFGGKPDKVGKNLGNSFARAMKTAGKQIRESIQEATAVTGALPPGSGTDKTKKELREAAARLRASHEAARQEAVDRAQLAVDRTALTKTVSDDIAALRNLNALLKRRIAGGHDTIEIERQQLQVQLQLNDLLAQQAEQAAAAAKSRRDARQFRLLGFGPTGEDIIPGVKGLKRQLASVADAVSGSFLDTRKTRGLLAHIRQVLSGGLGSVSSEVRSKIQQILADLKNQLKQSSVDVTRFQKTARGQFTLAGAHPQGGVVINGGVHLHGVQNVKQLEDALAKRTRQRAHARRSTR